MHDVVIIVYAQHNDAIQETDGEGGRQLKISARNTLKGKVQSVEYGTVNAEVLIELPGGIEVVSIITKDSAERLGLAPGKEAYAIIKATDVMVAID